MAEHVSSVIPSGMVPRSTAAPGVQDTWTAQRVVAGPEGRMIGPFALPDADGRTVRFRDYRQRRNLVVFFRHHVTCVPCWHILRALAKNGAVFHEQQAAVIAIGPDPGDRNQHLSVALEHAFPLLSDPQERSAARAGFLIPALVVADRWGEVWAAWEGGAAHALPQMDELEAWLTVIQCDCT